MIFRKIIIFVGLLFPLLVLSQNKDKELRSDHFIITYASDQEDIIYKLRDDAEYLYREITQEFGLVRDKLWSWDNRAKIIVAKDQEAYNKQFGCPAWSQACVDYYNKIIYTYPFQKDFYSILKHELTHIIFREYIGCRNLPLWLDEGMATYIEYKGTAQTGIMKTLIRKLIEDNKYAKFSTINQVYSPQGMGTDVALFYTQAFSMVYFLKERFGSGDFAEFLRCLRSGSSLENSLNKAFRVIENIDSFETAWKKFYEM